MKNAIGSLILFGTITIFSAAIANADAQDDMEAFRKGDQEPDIVVLTFLLFSTTSTASFGWSTDETRGGKSGASTLEENQRHFVVHNYDNLLQDVSRGEGQYLRSMALLFRCDDRIYPEFALMTQRNLGQFYTFYPADPDGLLSWFHDGLVGDSQIAQNCGADFKVSEAVAET